MDEKKIWECLKHSGDTVAVPESLLPEKVEDRLRKQKRRAEEKRKNIWKMTAAAACVCLCTVGLALAAPLIRRERAGDTSSAADDLTAAVTEETSGESAEGLTAARAEEYVPGDIRTAESYGEIYDLLREKSAAGEAAQPETSERTVTDGKFVYTLSEFSVTLPEEKREESISPEGLKKWFPGAGGEPAAPQDCWILWGGGTAGYLLTAAESQDPGEITDEKLILTGRAEVSMEEDRVVFTGSDDENEGKTAEFVLNAGKISYR